jgi:hypothetical protein
VVGRRRIARGRRRIAVGRRIYVKGMTGIRWRRWRGDVEPGWWLNQRLAGARGSYDI